MNLYLFHITKCSQESEDFTYSTLLSEFSIIVQFPLPPLSGRTEKEAAQEAKVGARTQPEFTRMPSRRYQRRIVEGAQDSKLGLFSLHCLSPVLSGVAGLFHFVFCFVFSVLYVSLFWYHL